MVLFLELQLEFVWDLRTAYNSRVLTLFWIMICKIVPPFSRTITNLTENLLGVKIINNQFTSSLILFLMLSLTQI